MSPRSTDATDVIVGRNIRIQRLARGMSQSALAEQIGITFQQVQKYEKGLNRVGSGRLARIAQVFGLPISALFDGAAVNRKRTPENSALHLIADRAPMRLVQAFAHIKDRGVRSSIFSW
jgi:transcriptional regulator with XRE-family HTH domain